MDNIESSSKPLPTYEWLQQNFKVRAAAIRYLYIEYRLDVKRIAGILHCSYRTAFGVVRKLKLEQQSIHERFCPVCKGRI